MTWKKFTCEEARQVWKEDTRWWVGENPPKHGGYKGKPTFDAPDLTYWLQIPDTAWLDINVSNPKLETTDIIKKPDHYYITVRGVEIDCWDVIKELGLWREYGIASAMKYLWRCLKKGNTLADLEKARAFLDAEIKMRKENGNV